MLHNTFTTYKEKFTEIMTIFKPLIIINIITGGLVVAMLSSLDMKNYPVGLILFLLVIVCGFIQVLIYTPAVVKTIQKRELGEATTIDESVAFQKNNKWKTFMVMVWTFVYSIYYMFLICIPIGAGMLLGIALGKIHIAVAILVSLVGLSIGIYAAYINLPKLFFALNIYLVKNTAPHDSVKESVVIGTQHRKTVWGYISGVLCIGILSFIITIPVSFFKVENSIAFDAVSMLISTGVQMLFILPLTYIYMSKAYVRTVSAAPAASSEAVIPEVVISNL